MRRKGLDPAALFAVVAEEKNALRLISLTQGAQAAGLYQGMALTDARGALPDLMTVVHAPLRMEEGLRALHRWAYNFSPWVSVEGQDGLLLDITGCAHLFGGEISLTQQIQKALEDFGFHPRLGVADTKGTAHAVARYGEQPKAPHAPFIVPPGKARQVLLPLPINALGTNERDLQGLRRLGLKTLGDVAALPRADLARRFGGDLCLHLDEALGARSTPVSPTVPPRIYAARISFPDPIGRTEDVMAALKLLLDRLCGDLTKQGRGIRTVDLIITGADGKDQTRQVSMARPCHAPQPILTQFSPLIDKLEAGFGIDRLRLVVRVHEPHQAQQLSTTDKGGLQTDRLADLIGRLGNRLGFDRVTVPRPQQSHLPGFDLSHPEAISGPPPCPWPSRTGPDPIRLSRAYRIDPLKEGSPPQAFRWRGRRMDVTHAQGPKRLSGEWWVQDPMRHATHDYWQVQTAQGERLWLACDVSGPTRHWFVKGQMP